MEPTPAGHLRELLAAERDRGQPFAAAWRRCLPLVLGPDPGHPTGRVERAAWAEALDWSRESWRRAYCREPRSGQDERCAALAEAADAADQGSTVAA